MPISLILTIVVASLRGAIATISGIEVFVTNASVKKILDEVKAGMSLAASALGGAGAEFAARVKKGDAKADDADMDGIDAEEFKDKKADEQA